ncbi:MAG: ferritin-like domain-containing protein [Thermoguttaceae bacterium]
MVAKTNDKVIQALNEARSMELTSVVQYMNQHYSLDNADYGPLAKQIKKIAIDEMKHAENFAERVKVLGGEPTTQLASQIEKGQSVDKIYPCNAASEEEAIVKYSNFAKLCRDNNDTISANLFESILHVEHEHCEYFKNIRDHIKNLGDAYLVTMLGGSDN